LQRKFKPKIKKIKKVRKKVATRREKLTKKKQNRMWRMTWKRSANWQFKN